MAAPMTSPPPPPPLPPPPIRRLAPRPLALHLAMAAATLFGSPGALPNSNPGSPLSKRLAAADPALAAALARADPEALRSALRAEILARASAFAAGIERYRRHPYRRAQPSWPEFWREGTTRLLDCAPGSGAPPVLLIPSLVNRGYILDLMPARSFVGALRAAGLRPLLLDWDRPGAVERGWGLDAYVAGRLGRCLAYVAAETGRRATLVGYCMGGLLALPLARAVDRVASLVLLATPWDFHAERPDLARALAAQAELWLPLAERAGEVPADMLQALFAGLDPLLALRKFVAFARAPDAGAADFVALEDWLNDGVPLAAPVARACLSGWYGTNETARGGWRIGGDVVDPARLDLPTLVVVPARDRIVPPPSALPLAQLIPGARALTPALGHIGMLASSRAPMSLWPEMVAWIRAHAAS
jgi:polyhydroxyalkanoate synthase